MNIKKVYLCNIYIKGERNPIYEKKTIALWGKTGIFIDLKTKERYKPGEFAAAKGQLFVDIGEMIPVSNVIEFKKEKATKGKILKKYTKFRTEGKNECK